MELTRNMSSVELDEGKKTLDECKIESFDDLCNEFTVDGTEYPAFDEKIIRGIYNYGFEYPTYIQQVGIRAIATHRDVIGQAQSGTGKTGAFTIGMLNNIDPTENSVQGIILVHTYEMVEQIHYIISDLAKYTDIRVTMCGKMVPVKENVRQISGEANNGLKPHILVGTPGRTYDMLTRSDRNGEYVVDTHKIKMIVLDEADELLGTTEKKGRNNRRPQNNFVDQIKQIISLLSAEVQICLFSATMNQRFFQLTAKLMRDPIKIVLKTEEVTLEGISQFYIESNPDNMRMSRQDGFNTKVQIIADIYSSISISKCVIYCNNIDNVENLRNELSECGFMVSVIHSKLENAERNEAMKKFRKNETNVLISTDLLGRGIDVQQISVVINFDVPFKIESYIHRIGRSGRHGRKGVAINLADSREMNQLDYIQKYYSTDIIPLPSDFADLITA